MSERLTESAEFISMALDYPPDGRIWLAMVQTDCTLVIMEYIRCSKGLVLVCLRDISPTLPVAIVFVKASCYDMFVLGHNDGKMWVLLATIHMLLTRFFHRLTIRHDGMEVLDEKQVAPIMYVVAYR